MRRLIPYLLPVVAFAAAAALATPGAAQDPPVETCAPMPACLPIDGGIATTQTCNPPTTSNPVPYCCPPTDCSPTGGPGTGVGDPTWQLDQPLADGGDAADTYFNSWSSCIINEGSIYAFTVFDPTLNQLPDSQYGPKANAAAYPPVGTQYTACLARVGAHHGLTHYKPYGKERALHPIGVSYAHHGNYGHKYDHEMYLRHCGGANDDDCWEEVLLRNKLGGGLHAYNYCTGLGFNGSGYCPNASYINVQIGVPWCKVGAYLHLGKVRNSCWYVY